MDDALIDSAEQLIDYKFNDRSLLEMALTHASVANNRLESNERMEFLGDAILGMVVVHDLYQRYPDLLEGEMTKIKSSVVSRQTCAKISQQTGLCEVIVTGKGMARPDGVPRSVAAAAFESIIGAIFLDGGLEPARHYIIGHAGEHIEEAFANEHQDNFKSMLQQHAQRKWNTTPDYRLLDEKGPDHSKCFEVAVVVDGRHFPSAWGVNKKEAEQDAARKALVQLGLIDEEQAPTGPADQKGQQL